MIMNKILYPGKEKWMKILERPENRGEDLDKVCKAVFDEVKRDGDEALKKYTWYFDRVKLECFEVTENEFQMNKKGSGCGIEGGDKGCKREYRGVSQDSDSREV